MRQNRTAPGIVAEDYEVYQAREKKNALHAVLRASV